MKPLFTFFVTIVIVAALLVLDQIWFGIVDTKYFWKIIITLGIIGAIAIIIFLIRNELVEDKEMKKDKFVD